MFLKTKILFVGLLVAAAGFYVYHHQSQASAAKQAADAAAAKVQTAKNAAAAELASHCASNTLDKEIVVSISRRHMWACEGSQTVYNNAVVTGMEQVAADLTPTGTYQIASKYTDQTLKGCDTTGCWNDFVSYWMPFLNNQYGTYGFHDATWRKDSDFGNIDPNSNNASHGCVEMPLAAAKWLYGWAPVGTTVTIES